MALFRVDYSGRGELADRQQHLAQMLSRLQKIAEGKVYFKMNTDVAYKKTIWFNQHNLFHMLSIFWKQEAQKATVAHLSTMNAREILEWNQK